MSFTLGYTPILYYWPLTKAQVKVLGSAENNRRYWVEEFFRRIEWEGLEPVCKDVPKLAPVLREVYEKLAVLTDNLSEEGVPAELLRVTYTEERGVHGRAVQHSIVLTFQYTSGFELFAFDFFQKGMLDILKRKGVT